MNARAVILAGAIALLGLSAFSFAPALAQRGDDPPLRLADAHSRCRTGCTNRGQQCNEKAKSDKERVACTRGIRTCWAQFCG
jgi:hypothetical protein